MNLLRQRLILRYPNICFNGEIRNNQNFMIYLPSPNIYIKEFCVTGECNVGHGHKPSEGQKRVQ